MYSKLIPAPSSETCRDAVAVFDAFARLLGSLVDRNYPVQNTHSERVGVLACRIGKRMNLPTKSLENLYWAGVLHDIGKLLIPADVVFKKEAFNTDDWETIRAHPLIGASLLESIPFFAEIVPAILYHHERIDGNGYPRGISGEDIPLDARIISVAEAFDAMTEGTYRMPIPLEAAIEELTRESGKQFDGGVVQALIRELTVDHSLSETLLN